ncbi:MAG: site-specific integrase [Oscillospiraceae bacterium]|nr:site-specific integrase [Oscillospiraceae bacterium]
MASIKKLEGKKGTSYRIEVVTGTLAGKVKREYKTISPAELQGKTARQIEKYVKQAADDFERGLAQGFDMVSGDKQTFEQYASYVMDLKKQQGCETKTLDAYAALLKRINPAIGHLKLSEIRPQHLNLFYRNLAEGGIRISGEKAKPRKKTPDKIISFMKGNGFTSKESFSRHCGIAPASLDVILKGNQVNRATAEKVAAPLGLTVESLFTVSQNAKPLSSKTCLEHHRLISTILSQAEKEMLVPYNAAAKATPPKLERPEIETLQPEELKQVIDALALEPLKQKTIVYLMIATGARRGEILGLHWEDVDLDNYQIRIAHNLLYSKSRGVYETTPKTKQSNRYIKIPEDAKQLLEQWQLEQGFAKKRLGDAWIDTPYVFTQDNGDRMHPDSITAWLNDFAARHELVHLHPHLFRHAMASLLIANHIDILAVSKRLGHSRTSTTVDIYATAIKAADEAASDCIADVLFKKPEQKQAQAQ